MLKRKQKELKHIAGKVAAIFLVSIYLLFSVGVIKATHFCMGRKASVAFFTADAGRCPCSLYSGEKDSCCNDSHELIRIDNAQKIITSLSLDFPEWFEIETIYTRQFVAEETAFSAHWDTDILPPPKIPLWKLHCNFVFYDDGLTG